MIFYWLRLAWLKVTWLFTPPTARQIARVDKNSPCPACGAKDGELACVFGAGVDSKPDKVLIRHTCHECGARWHERSVTDASVEEVWGKDDVRTTLSRSGRAA